MTLWNLFAGRKTEADVANAAENGSYQYGQLAELRPIRMTVGRRWAGVDNNQLLALLRLSQSFDAREKRDLLDRLLNEPPPAVCHVVSVLTDEFNQLLALSREQPRVLYQQEQRVLAEWAVIEASCCR